MQAGGGSHTPAHSSVRAPTLPSSTSSGRQSLEQPGGGVGRRDTQALLPRPHSSANELEPDRGGVGKMKRVEAGLGTSPASPAALPTLVPQEDVPVPRAWVYRVVCHSSQHLGPPTC